MRSMNVMAMPRSALVRGAAKDIKRLQGPLVERPAVKQHVRVDAHIHRQRTTLAGNIYVLLVGPDDDPIQGIGWLALGRSARHPFRLVGSESGPCDGNNPPGTLAELLVGKGAVPKQYSLAGTNKPDRSARSEQDDLHLRACRD